MEELSIIILTCNQCAYTMRCLDSIKGCGAEIIVVDNGSIDNTVYEIEKIFPEVIIVKNTENKGVAAGRNIGLQTSSGKYLMILDNDTEADADVIKKLLNYLKSHPETGLVAPALYSEDGVIQESYKDFPGLLVKIRNALGLEKKVKTPVSSEIHPFYVIGAAQMFSRETLEKVGDLDENIFYGPEDADFCMRIRKKGLDITYLPDLKIIHHWQRATSRRFLSPLGRKHIKALLYFYRKWKRIF